MGDEVSTNFHEMGLDDRLLEAIARLGWAKPTLIQEKSIPIFLKGKDILARARTGSGKTGAFLIPLVHKILEIKPCASKQIILALILAPSKELATQISKQVNELTALCRREVRCVDVSPQVPMATQKPLLADHPDIVVGTPSKILSHIGAKNLDLENLKFLIIDEADLMMAFEHQNDLNSLLKKIPKLHQSFMTSATLPDDVKLLKDTALSKPVVLKLTEPPLPTASHLTHYVIKVEEHDKVVMLYSMFRLNLLQGKTIVFVNTVNKGYKIKMFLSMFSIRSCVLNSELPVNSRCSIVESFNSGAFTILIASDVNAEVNADSKQKKIRKKIKQDKESGIARGVDFWGVSNVINFDFPLDSLAYIHRVGRTARGGDTGSAVSLVSSHELRKFEQVQKELNEIMDSKNVFRDYKFNMLALDGFRYRANEAWGKCTTIAVKDFRRKELKSELLSSQKLKSFFEENPNDFEAIKRTGKVRNVEIKPHLKNVPEYNIPEALKRISASSRKCAKIKRSKVIRNSKKTNRQKDPLKTFKFTGFNK